MPDTSYYPGRSVLDDRFPAGKFGRAMDDQLACNWLNFDRNCCPRTKSARRPEWAAVTTLLLKDFYGHHYEVGNPPRISRYASAFPVTRDESLQRQKV
jgi:hypothetical protein